MREICNQDKWITESVKDDKYRYRILRINGKDLFDKYYIVYSQYSSNLVCIYNKLCVHVKITVYN